MSQKPINMSGIDAYLTIVPVMSMTGRSEHARRDGSRNLFVSTAQQERIRPAAHFLCFVDEELYRMFLRSGDVKAETVQQTARTDPNRFRRDIIPPGLFHECGSRGRRLQSLGDSGKRV